MENLTVSNINLVPIKTALVEGLTIASGAKSSATYYHTKENQIKAIKGSILNAYNVSKEIPLILANQDGATGFFISEVLLNEFKHTTTGGACNIVNPIDWYDNGLADKAILSALNRLGNNGLPYVLRLFMNLKKEHVNNERARKIILGYIWSKPNLEFHSVKYRNKIAEVLKHIYGVKKLSTILNIIKKQDLSSEKIEQIVGTSYEVGLLNNNIFKYSNFDYAKSLKIFLFIFKMEKLAQYEKTTYPIISEYVNAKQDITNIKLVPEEVLLGIISSKSHPQHDSMWSNSEQRKETQALIRKNVQVTSVNQQVRQTKSTAKLGVEREVKLEEVTDYIALYKTGYETSFNPKLVLAIDSLGEKKRINNFQYQNIGIIHDKSVSMNGNKLESKNTPRAIADFTSLVLRKSAEKSVYVATNGDTTDLASSFVELIEKETEPYDAIFIITDGYENSYDGLLNEVINIYKRESNNDAPIFQISPITGAEMDANVRKIGDSAIVMSINNPSAIQPQIAARLLDIDIKLWLKNQVLSIEASTETRNKRINN